VTGAKVVAGATPSMGPALAAATANCIHWATSAGSTGVVGDVPGVVGVVDAAPATGAIVAATPAGTEPGGSAPSGSVPGGVGAVVPSAAPAAVRLPIIGSIATKPTLAATPITLRAGRAGCGRGW
jgi:hypothetical protein